MRVNSKKATFAVLFLVLLLSSFILVYAQDEEIQQIQTSRGVSVSIRRWFSSIKSSDTGIQLYDNNKTLIDFAIFFTIFLAISILSLNRFLGAAGKNAMIALSLALSTALALAAIKAGMSITFFIPFVKNAIFFIMFILIFLLFRRMGMNSIFWNILLSLILTYLLFNVGNIILDKDKQLNLGNLFGTPSTSEGLAQTKFELTKTNARFSALQDSISKNDIYKDFRGPDNKVQYNELIRAREHYYQKQIEAEAAGNKEEAKKNEEILEIVDDHIERWDEYKSDLLQGYTQFNELSGKGHATNDMHIPTAPVLRLDAEERGQNQWLLNCKIIKPSTLPDVDLMPPSEKIFYEFSWYKNNILVESLPKQTYKALISKVVEAKTTETWYCIARVSLSGFNNSAFSNVLAIGPQVKPVDQTNAVLKQADEKIDDAEKDIGIIKESIKEAESETDPAKKENKFKAVGLILPEMKSHLDGIKNTLKESLDSPQTSASEKTEINKRMTKLESLFNEISKIADEIKAKTKAGAEETKRKEDAAKALAEEAKKKAEEAKAAEEIGDSTAATAAAEEAASAAGKALDLGASGEDAEEAKKFIEDSYNKWIESAREKGKAAEEAEKTDKKKANELYLEAALSASNAKSEAEKLKDEEKIKAAEELRSKYSVKAVAALGLPASATEKRFNELIIKAAAKAEEADALPDTDTELKNKIRLYEEAVGFADEAVSVALEIPDEKGKELQEGAATMLVEYQKRLEALKEKEITPAEEAIKQVNDLLSQAAALVEEAEKPDTNVDKKIELYTKAVELLDMDTGLLVDTGDSELMDKVTGTKLSYKRKLSELSLEDEKSKAEKLLNDAAEIAKEAEKTDYNPSEKTELYKEAISLADEAFKIATEINSPVLSNQALSKKTLYQNKIKELESAPEVKPEKTVDVDPKPSEFKTTEDYISRLNVLKSALEKLKAEVR